MITCFAPYSCQNILSCFRVGPTSTHDSYIAVQWTNEYTSGVSLLRPKQLTAKQSQSCLTPPTVCAARMLHSLLLVNSLIPRLEPVILLWFKRNET